MALKLALKLKLRNLPGWPWNAFFLVFNLCWLSGGVSGQAFASAEQSKADSRAESQGNRGTSEAASIHGDAKVHRGLFQNQSI